MNNLPHLKKWIWCSALLGGTVCLPLPAHAQVAPTHLPDGGTRNQIQSIMIPPAPDAPFKAIVVTQSTRILPDGSKQTIWNRRTVARDSTGRVFQERRWLMPNGDTEPTALSSLQYQDPRRHQMIVCDPGQRVCTQYTFHPPANLALPPAGPLANGSGAISREDLGRKTVDGLDLEGSRETTTINAGARGNEQAEAIVKEFWYSPQLGIDVSTTRSDPFDSSVQDFEVTNVELAEPSSKMFEPPADYRIVNVGNANNASVAIYNDFVLCPAGCFNSGRRVIVRRRP